NQPEPVGNAHPAKGDEIPLAEAVHVEAMADTHVITPCRKTARDSTRLCRGALDSGQALDVIAQVFLDEAGHEEVAVVIARTAAQRQRIAAGLGAGPEYLGLELQIAVLVGLALIHQDRQ